MTQKITRIIKEPLEIHPPFSDSKTEAVFRSTHALATESPCILGCSPWLPKTWQQLAEVKLGVVEIKQTAILQAAAEAEDRIRVLYKNRTGGVGNDRCISKGIFASSLDWADMDLTRIAEFKTPTKGSKDPLFAKEEVKDNVYAQVQHQLMVSDAEECDLVIYANDVDEIIIIPIIPDEKYQKNLKEKWEEFWSYYSEGKQLPAQKGDVIDLSHDEGMVAMAQNYHLARKELDQAKAKEEKIRTELIKNAFDRSIKVEGLIVERVLHPGSIDIEALKEDQDLKYAVIERHRNPATIDHVIKET